MTYIHCTYVLTFFTFCSLPLSCIGDDLSIWQPAQHRYPVDGYEYKLTALTGALASVVCQHIFRHLFRMCPLCS